MRGGFRFRGSEKHGQSWRFLYKLRGVRGFGVDRRGLNSRGFSFPWFECVWCFLARLLHFQPHIFKHPLHPRLQNRKKCETVGRRENQKANGEREVKIGLPFFGFSNLCFGFLICLLGREEGSGFLLGRGRVCCYQKEIKRE